MDLRQLKQFTVLAEELNFRRAATRLHMTQPPLSAAIQRLEESVGVLLFDRDRSKVRLTAAGTAFLREVRQLLAQAEAAVATARSAEQGVTDALRIAAVDSVAFELLPGILQTFCAAFPSAQISLQMASTENAIAALHKGTLDVAIIVPSANPAGGLTITALTEERFCLAVAAHHRLSHRRTVRLSELADDQFVSLYPFSSGPGYSVALLQAFHDAKIYPRIAPGDSRTLANLVLVSAGVSVALVPRPVRHLQVAGVTFLDVVSEARKPLRYPLALAKASGNDSPLVKVFEDMAREAVAGKRKRPTRA